MKQLTRLYLETDVCGWCYALLVLHVGNEEEGDLRMPQMCSVLISRNSSFTVNSDCCLYGHSYKASCARPG